jgi:hypothetical protein
MFVWIWKWKAARAAATFDAITLVRVYGQRALAEAQILAARAQHDGRGRHLRHWRLVAKTISRLRAAAPRPLRATAPGLPEDAVERPLRYRSKLAA